MKTFRKFLSLILSIFTVLPFVTACDEQKTIGIIGGADGPTAILVSGFGENQSETDDTKSAETESETTEPDEVTLDIDGIYDSRDDVALYLHIYGYLPKNYITKAEAKVLGEVVVRDVHHSPRAVVKCKRWNAALLSCL